VVRRLALGDGQPHRKKTYVEQQKVELEMCQNQKIKTLPGKKKNKHRVNKSSSSVKKTKQKPTGGRGGQSGAKIEETLNWDFTDEISKGKADSEPRDRGARILGFWKKLDLKKLAGNTKPFFPVEPQTTRKM